MTLKTKFEEDKKALEAELAKYKKTDEKNAITAYAQTTYLYLLDKNGPAPTNDASLKTNMDDAKTAVSAIKPKPDLKVIETAAGSKANLEVFMIKNFKKDLTSAGNDGQAELDVCKVTVDLDYNVQQAEAVDAGNQKQVDAANDRIDIHTYASLMTCDAKAGVVFKTWGEAKCEGETDFSLTAKWGECTKAGDVYIKVTGAAALKAAAVALVAFAGSQF